MRGRFVFRLFLLVLIAASVQIRLFLLPQAPSSSSTPPTRPPISDSIPVVAHKTVAQERNHTLQTKPVWVDGIDDLEMLHQQQSWTTSVRVEQANADIRKHLQNAHSAPAPFGWKCDYHTRPEFVSTEVIDFLKENLLIGIITGAKFSHRLQISLCSWLSHMPMSNILLFTDDANPQPHPTPAGTLNPIPYDLTSFYDFNIVEAPDDLLSIFFGEGYYSQMVNQKKKTNYTLGWVKAQYRFVFALHTLTLEQHTQKFKYVFLIDDDTFIQWNNLYKRLKALDHKRPYYLNSKGWGGSGHLFTTKAAAKLHPHLKNCVYKYMIVRWGSSDGMLDKCAGTAGLLNTNEPNFQWCGARAVGNGFVPNPDLYGAITIHAKIEYKTCPSEYIAWRMEHHYEALYNRSNKGAHARLMSTASCGMCAAGVHGNCKKEEKASTAYAEFLKETGYSGNGECV